MTIKARKDGLILVFLGATVVLLTLGFLLHGNSRGAALDFIPDYYAARCLIDHCDPYKESEVLQTYRAEGGERSLDDPVDRAVATRYVYPPSAFTVMVPFAFLPWNAARILWTIFSACTFIIAAFLAWDLSADHAPVVSGALIGYLLANSEILVVLSNPSELVISFCVIAVWCFIRNRLIPVGILCLALSLAVKPQDPGLIWLYFLLAGGTFRKRALQTLFVTVLLSAPFILWVSWASPHWMHELQANLLAFSQHGGLNDPGPASELSVQFADLQAVLSRFHDQPDFYNLVSYLIFLPLFGVWAAITLRTRLTMEKAALALAAITPLSMLPIHHHLYDTKLMLLAIPGLALLWVRRDRRASVALALTAGTLFFIGDVSNWLVSRLATSLHSAPGSAGAWISDAVVVFPPALSLLITGSFYLWAYWQAAWPRPTSAHSEALAHSTPVL
jgi:hypothetical protein